MNVKQVIIVRTRYPHKDGGTRGLRTGKLVVQGAHAAMGAYIMLLHQLAQLEPSQDPGEVLQEIALQDMEATWWGAGATKVCLQVETEAELQELFRRAEKMNLPCHLVTDRGLTEFDGVPTVTALGIGPASSETIDEITRDLKLF